MIVHYSCTRLGVEWFLWDLNWLITKVVLRKGCNDWSDMSYFSPLGIMFGCDWVNHFMNIPMHSRMLSCSNKEDSTVQLESLTYSCCWGNATNYLQGLKLRNNLPIPHHFLTSISPKRLDKSQLLLTPFVFLPWDSFRVWSILDYTEALGAA